MTSTDAAVKEMALAFDKYVRLNDFIKGRVKNKYSIKFRSKDLERDAIFALTQGREWVGITSYYDEADGQCYYVEETIFEIVINGCEITCPLPLYIRVSTIDMEKPEHNYIMTFRGEIFNSGYVNLDNNFDKNNSDSLYPAKVAELFNILNIPSEEYFEKIDQ